MSTKSNSNSKVRGVNVDKVNIFFLLAAGKSLGIWPNKEDVKEKPTSVLIEEFDDAMRAKAIPEDLLKCDNCGGRSIETLDECPYCGDSDSDDKPAAPAEAKTEEPANASPEKAKDTVAEKTTRVKKTSGDPEKVKKPKGEEKSSKKSAAAAKPEETKAIVHEAKPEPKLPAATAKLSQNDLDNAVTKVQILKAEGAVNLWKLGAEIKSIHDSQLYKLRTDDGGKPRYKGFEAFVNNELGMSAQNAYELMDISAKFTETQVRAFGTSKLGLLLKAPEEARAEILDKVKAGASAREVREEVAKARDKAGIKKGEHVQRDPKRKKTTGASKGAPAERITIANVLGRQRVKLYIKGTGKGGEEPKRAKRLADNPWGVFELSNSVKLFVAVTTDPNGEMVAVLDFKRDA